MSEAELNARASVTSQPRWDEEPLHNTASKKLSLKQCENNTSNLTLESHDSYRNPSVPYKICESLHLLTQFNADFKGKDDGRSMWQRLITVQAVTNKWIVLLDYVLMILHGLFYATRTQLLVSLPILIFGYSINHMCRPSYFDVDDEVKNYELKWPRIMISKYCIDKARAFWNMIIFIVRFHFLNVHKGLLLPLVIQTIASSPRARNSYWPLIPACFMFANYALFSVYSFVGVLWHGGAFKEALEILFEFFPYVATIIVVTLFMVTMSFFLALEFEKLSKTSNQLKEALTMKDNFVSHISHEFRCPVLSSMGSIELLKDTNLTEEQKDHVETVETANGIVLSLIEDILNYLRLEHEKLDEVQLAKNNQRQIEVFSLGSCIHMVHNIIKSYASQVHVNVKVNTNDVTNISVKGNQIRLYQCLTNLLTNAVKASHQNGSVELHCSLLSNNQVRNPKRDHIYLEFKIVDHGIGIEEDKQGLLFQPFVQLHETNESIYPGTGLGLVAVKNNVDVMGGTITFTSKPGLGTTFTMVIPFEKVNTDSTLGGANYVDQVHAQKQYMETYMKAKKHSSQSNVEANVANTSQPSIILAEDNAINRMVILKLLKSLGYEAEAVCDGRELVQKVNPQYHRLVITDFNMPNMDGLQAAEEIRKLHGSSIKIILLTADVLKEQKNMGQVIDSVMYKPCSKQDLKTQIENVLVCN